MAVVAGTDKPTAAQYNSIQTTMNTVLATRWGQTPSSSQLTLPGTSTKITSAAWTNLRSDILKANRHIYLVANRGTLTDPTTSTVIAAADYNAYETMANDSSTNYLQFPYDHPLGSINSVGFQMSSIPQWGRSTRSKLQYVLLGRFPSNAGARYFYNSGGQTRFDTILTGAGVANVGSKDYSWRSAVNEMGTLVMTANATTSINTTAGLGGTGSAIGWYQLTTSDQLVFSKSTTTYSPNSIKIYARCNGDPATTATILTLTIVYFDENDPAGTYTIDEDVGATFQVNLASYYSSGTGEVNVTGYRPNLELSTGPTVLA